MPIHQKPISVASAYSRVSRRPPIPTVSTESGVGLINDMEEGVLRGGLDGKFNRREIEANIEHPTLTAENKNIFIPMDDIKREW